MGVLHTQAEGQLYCVVCCLDTSNETNSWWGGEGWGFSMLFP